MSNSIQFSEQFYLSTYPDVAAAVSRGVFASGQAHYNANGRFEGRNPNQFFNTSEYLGRYPDVARAGVNPFQHFLTSGAAEGRFANSNEDGVIDLNNNDVADDFNNAAYLAQYPDVAAQTGAGRPFATAYQHFVQFGQFEGRTGTLTNGATVTGPFANGGTGGGSPTTGNVIALTTGSDNITGTSGSDIVTGDVSFTDAAAGTTVASGTFAVTDSINGGAGNDTLSLTVAGGGATYTTGALPTASITGVETLNIRAVQVQAADIITVSAAIPGLTAVNSDRSTSAVTVTGLAAGASVGVIGNGAVANGAVSATYVDAATSAVVNVAGGTTAGAVSVAGNGLTSTTVNSTVGANTLTSLSLAGTTTTATINASSNLTTGTLTAAALTTLNVTGSASSVNVGQLTGAVTTVDASGLTVGGLTATLDTAITSFKGGQGSDVVTTNVLTATTAGIINAGAGTDTLVVADGGDVNTAAKGAVYTGFETLRNNAGANIDASLIAGITSVESNNAAAGFTKLTAAQAANIKVLVTNTSGTFALANAAGTADVLGLTLAPLTASTVTTPIDATGLTVTGFETVNVVSSSGVKANTTPANANQLSFAAAGDVTAVNIGGEYDLTLTTTNITKAVTVNTVQTGTAVLNVTGNVVKGSVINTSANADVITTTAAVAGSSGEFVTYNAGAGNDTINTTAAAVNNTSAGNASLKIDGGAGVDTVNFTGAGTALVDGNFQYITNVEKIGFTGGGAISLTSGGFFEANFKAAGADVSGTFGTVLAGAGAAAVIDLTSFSGVAKVALTEIAAGAVADRFSVNTGSGNDVVTITTNAALTSTNTVSTGLGNDTITLTNAALGGGGTITVNAGAGIDTIVGGDSASTLIGGTGADTLTGGLGADTFQFSKGDSGITTGNIDIITDFVAGTDKLQFAGITDVVSVQQTAVQAAVTALAAGATVTQIGAAMATANTTDNGVAFATFGGNTYVYYEAAGASSGVEANDLLIQLTGVTTVPVFATDVVA